jgi:hypothetical protein
MGDALARKSWLVIMKNREKACNVAALARSLATWN